MGRGGATKKVLPERAGARVRDHVWYDQGRGRAGDVRLSPWEGRELVAGLGAP
jgi:hypothetical protein